MIELGRDSLDRPTYSFGAPPSPGATYVFSFGRGDDQPYSIIAVRPYTRKDGAASCVITWRSVCSRCNRNPVFIEAGMSGRIATRRCTACQKIRKKAAMLHASRRPKGWRGKYVR